MTGVPHFDCDEGRINILNLSNKRSPPPHHQTRYVRLSDIPFAYGTTLSNSPSWQTGKKMIITEGQAVANAAEHRVALMEITISCGEVLVIWKQNPCRTSEIFLLLTLESKTSI